MYNVTISHECACLKKSDYNPQETFDTQRDAYNYSNIVTELMNDEFCTTHLFSSKKIGDNDFLISVTENPNAGSSCSTDSCGSCGC